jgi:bifunctional non-homologous end joining protein LigD
VKLPGFYQPQLATLVDSVPPGDEWLHEIKFDGYRMICRIDKGGAALLTREAHDWTARFSAIVEAVKALPVRQAVLDGEIVALKDDGTTDFQLLQNSLREKAPANLVYFVFDLLYLDGRDLTGSPLLARKEQLEKLFKAKQKSASDRIRFSEHWVGQGEALFKKACESGLEGIISKRKDQPYRPTRSRDWLKIKCVHSQEFVIGGYSDPAGARSGLGALLLGVYDDEGSLHYAGRVGTGFSEKTLADLRARLDKLGQRSSPFVDPPGRQSKDVHWVKPELVGEVVFTQWTQDNVLRHPSFRGLREDKPAADVRREKTAPTSKVASSENHSSAATEIAGIQLTHPERVLYPDQGITKIELARYYEEIADWIMPHLSDRPLTLVRCPEGYKKQCFYQRHAQDSLDEAIHRVKVKDNGATVSYVAVDSLNGLIALVQMGVLEIHTWGARRDHIDQPDQLIFDLDPDPTVSWNALKEAAVMLRARLADLGLSAFLKTTGGKGLHVVVPIAPKQHWNVVKEFTKSVAQSLARENPERFTATMSKAKRKGKIFIDYLRNAKTATAVCAYSTRARSGAPISVPLRWQELKDDVREEFTVRNVPKRLSRLKKDPWDGFDAARTTITERMLKKL